MVHVELRDSTSIFFDCNAPKRSLAESASNCTLLVSLKIAAASARQKSTSKPLHSPPSERLEKPSTPSLTPQMSVPRCLTACRVCAGALVVSRRHPTEKQQATPRTKVARLSI